MATIIAVHGTNATGPEEGTNWWQRTSEFERDVREFVQADDGKIDFKPLIWDGLNSETSRRKAGTKLLLEIERLEKQGTQYCLVGHSHGGSVINHALIQNVVRGGELEHLSRWITVATPFIQTRMNRLLFDRLGLIGRSAYLAGVVSFVYTLLGAAEASFERSFREDFSEQPFLMTLSLVFGLVEAFVPILVLYGAAWLLLRRAGKRYALSTLRKVAECFGKSHLALCHMNDEAVEGLRAAGYFSLSIFDRRFAFGPLILICAAALPIISHYQNIFLNSAMDLIDVSINSQIKDLLHSLPFD